MPKENTVSVASACSLLPREPPGGSVRDPGLRHRRQLEGDVERETASGERAGASPRGCLEPKFTVLMFLGEEIRVDSIVFYGRASPSAFSWSLRLSYYRYSTVLCSTVQSEYQRSANTTRQEMRASESDLLQAPRLIPAVSPRFAVPFPPQTRNSRSFHCTAPLQ